MVHKIALPIQDSAIVAKNVDSPRTGTCRINQEQAKKKCNLVGLLVNTISAFVAHLVLKWIGIYDNFNQRAVAIQIFKWPFLEYNSLVHLIRKNTKLAV